MFQKKDKEIIELLKQEAFHLADQSAAKDADGLLAGKSLDLAYESLRARKPIAGVISDLRKFYTQNLLVAPEKLQTYRLLKLFSTLAAYSSNEEIALSKSTGKTTMGRLSGMLLNKLKHFSLVPDNEYLAPVTLDAGMLYTATASKNRQTDLSEPDTESEKSPALLEMNSSGRYKIALDDVTGALAELEIGDGAIRLRIEGFTEIQERLQVFFNGIDDDCQQDPVWISDDECYVRHDFENPELLNVSVIQPTEDSGPNFVIWAGVEKELICSILEQMFSDPRKRFSWWWNPIDDLDGKTPMEFVQSRNESSLLDYLCRSMNLDHLLD